MNSPKLKLINPKYPAVLGRGDVTAKPRKTKTNAKPDSFEKQAVATPPKKEENTTPWGWIIGGGIAVAAIAIALWQQETWLPKIKKWAETTKVPNSGETPKPSENLPAKSWDELTELQLDNTLSPAQEKMQERNKELTDLLTPEQTKTFEDKIRGKELSTPEEISNYLQSKAFQTADGRKLLAIHRLQEITNPENDLVKSLPWEHYKSEAVTWLDMQNGVGSGDKNSKNLTLYLAELDNLSKNLQSNNSSTLLEKSLWFRFFHSSQPVNDPSDLLIYLHEQPLNDFEYAKQVFLKWGETIKKRLQGELVNGFPAEFNFPEGFRYETSPKIKPLALDYNKSSTVRDSLKSYINSQPSQSFGMFLKEFTTKKKNVYFEPWVWLKSENETYLIELTTTIKDTLLPISELRSINILSDDSLKPIIDFNEKEHSLKLYPLVEPTPLYNDPHPIFLPQASQ